MFLFNNLTLKYSFGNLKYYNAKKLTISSFSLFRNFFNLKYYILNSQTHPELHSNVYKIQCFNLQINFFEVVKLKISDMLFTFPFSALHLDVEKL